MYKQSKNPCLDKIITKGPTEKYAVLLIDMQDSLVRNIKDNQEILIKSNIEMLEYCSKEDIPLIELNYLGYGNTIQEFDTYIASIPRHKKQDKSGRDGFYNPKLREQLEKWEIKHLCLIGIYASLCVKATAQGALNHGYHIATADTLIADYNTKSEKVTNWFKENGLYYNHHMLLKERMS